MRERLKLWHVLLLVALLSPLSVWGANTMWSALSALTGTNLAGGDRMIIAEELIQRIVNRLPEKARRVAPLLLRMPAIDRAALLAAFDAEGRLKNPFPDGPAQ